eukprot:gene27244-biopygen17771
MDTRDVIALAEYSDGYSMVVE